MNAPALFKKAYPIDPVFYWEERIVSEIENFFSDGAEYSHGVLTLSGEDEIETDSLFWDFCNTLLETLTAKERKPFQTAKNRNFSEQISKLRSEKLGFFRFRKIDAETFVITTDSGKFTLLTPDEFGEFLKGNPPDWREEELIEKGFLKSPDYIEKSAREYVRKYPYLGAGPSLHIIVITLRCNHSCRYCHASAVAMDREGFDMDIETARKVIDTIFFTTAPSVTIEFQGGEPLVNWEVLKFCVEYAEEKSKRVGKAVGFTIVSNLSLMTEEKLEYFVQHEFNLNTSLDGNAITHNFNRLFHGGNSFEKATYWIRRINELVASDYGSMQKVMGRGIGAMVTVTRKTLEHWQACIDTYVEFGMKEIFWRPLHPYGFWAVTKKQLGYSIEEFIESYKQVLEYIIQLNINGVRLREVYATIFLRKIFQSDPNYVDTRSPCGAVIGQVAYNYDGKIYTCDEGRMLGKMGDDLFLVTELKDTGRDTYKAMYASDTTKAMVSVSTIDGAPGFEDHAYKPYLWSCPIHNYKHNGSLYPNFSDNPKIRLETAILDFLFQKMRDPAAEKVFSSWINRTV